MLKKGIALFMAICMMSTCVPTAFAEEPLAPALAESTSVAAESAASQSVPASAPATPAESAPQSESASASTSAPQSESASASTSAPQSESASASTSAPQSESASASTSAPQSASASASTSAPQSTPASASTSAPQSTPVSASTSAPQSESASASESTSSELNGNVKTPMDGDAKSAVKPYETATYELTYYCYAGEVTITGIFGTASGELVLPATIKGKKVTSIGGWAFRDCGFTGNLTIPDSVTTIGSSAFYGCNGFTGSLTIPNSVTSIGERAFYGCSGFTGSLTLPNSLITIEQRAFYGCSGFTGSLTLPNSLTTIEQSAFYGCSGFTGNLTIPSGVTNIGRNAFNNCNGLMGILMIPSSVTTIGEYAFDYALRFVIGKANSYAQTWAKQNNRQFIAIADDFQGLVLNQTKLSLEKGNEEFLHALVLPFSANQTVTWTSSDAAVASVENGKVTALKIGKATITASANGKSATCEVLVKTVLEPGVAGFVERLYSVALGRESDIGGKIAWIALLKCGKVTGADAARSFVLSTEMNSRNLSNEEFMSTIYETFFNRAPDADGMKGWMNFLDNGLSREFVVSNFAGSNEFQTICNEFGVKRGSIPAQQPRDKNPNLTAFVNRLYTKLLDRQGEEAGLNNWCAAILAKTSTPKKIAHDFVFSKEFELKKLNDEKFVEYMYRAFMGREYDAAGKAAWVKYLQQGKTREDVFNGFADSTEFANIIKGFGL